MSTKRKREDDPSESHGSTVFVSNLPYNVTSIDVQTLFSDIAPVKSAFVVLDKETKTSKGVGYVSFATREDAEKAVTGETIQMAGRTLRVDWAGVKPRKQEGEPTVTLKPKPKVKQRPPRPTTSQIVDPDAIRTIVISGLPEGVDSKVLWKKIRKLNGAERVEWPGKSIQGQDDPSLAYGIFTTPAQASAASEKLHAHIYKGAVLSVTLKKRMDHLSRVGGPSRSSRLIVRNIPWNADENLLRGLFLPYGPIYSIHFPTSETADSSGKAGVRARGFAFVWMLSRQDAEKALELVNGKAVGDGDTQRVVAVDWALSKDRWEKEKVEETDQMDVDQQEKQEEDNSGDDEEAFSQAEGSSEDSGGSSSSRAETDDDEPITPPKLPQTDVGTTLFIRNLPFEATEEELRILFRAFGPLRYARITMGSDGRSRGTGFACFWNKEDADKAIAQAELLVLETGVLPTTRNPFTLPSLLTPDPSASLARSLVLHGRTLDVSRAVTRDQADKLKDQGEKQRQKEDKRNQYLMREGVIFPNTPAASTISIAELDKRVTAFNERRALLRSNPSLFISKTRLSVRQLPTFASERTLKRLAIHATREFEKEVAAGTRVGLSVDELEPDEESEETKKGAVKRKKGERATCVKQAKVVRQQERIDAVTGKGKSKGYGFLETITHADALRVLRWSNNNPAVSPLLEEWWKDEMNELLETLQKGGRSKKEPIPDEERARLKRLQDRISSGKIEGGGGKRALVMEFSIENIVVVKKRQEMQHQAKDRQTEEAQPARKKIKLEAEQGASPKKAPTKPIPKRSSTDAEPVSKDSGGSGRRGLGAVIAMKRKQRRAKATAAK